MRALQARVAALDATVRKQTAQLREAGVAVEGGGGGGGAGGAEEELEEKVFGELNFKFRPPDGWPAEIAYTNQLLWDNVPEGFQFFRSKIADPSAVRRPHRLKIVKIRNRKHPCFGESGLVALEPIAKGERLLDYAGKVAITHGQEHDTSKSSYLLNLFTDDEAGVWVDIDAASAGNEARFLNDWHGHPDQSKPNCQFWPYFDEQTGEKRMAIKTIADIVAGQELLVDYGGRYFAKDESDDSDMRSSDDEFEEEAPKKKRRR